MKTKKRHRYIGFKIITSNPALSKSFVIKSIQKQCKIILGKDSSEIGIRLIRFEDECGIIKCNHIEKENVINLLKSIKKIDNYDVEVDTIATSGTIKSLINKHFKLS